MILQIWSVTDFSDNYSESLRAGSFRDRIPIEARFFVYVQMGLGAHPASRIMGTQSHSQRKAPGAWRSPPTPPSVETEERVQL
jgi:hypothetical protein